MVSVTAIIRSGYYLLRMIPSLLWLTINVRTRIGHITDAFEDQLIQSGLDRDISRELSKAYHDANKELVSLMTSPKSWTG